MRQLTQNLKTGDLKIEDVPAPMVKSGGLLVRNYCSLISAGTERAFVDLGQKSLLGKAKDRPDLVKKVMRQVKQEGVVNTFRKVMEHIDTPLPLGYSSSGVVEVIGAGIHEFTKGDIVACAGAKYANHAEFVFIPQNLCVKVPEGVDHESAAFTTLGSIAMQGVRRAEPQLGDNVAVIGLGLVGQIAIQILKANGCRVLGIDIDPEKNQLAKKMGIDEAVEIGDAHKACHDFSNGIGMDFVVITAATHNSGPIEMAGEISRDRGRVVVIGDVGMNVPRDIYYKKELDLRLSRSYGPGRYDAQYEERGIDYPISYVRWTEKRNMEEFLRLVALGNVRPKELITHRFDFNDAIKAYNIITGKVQEKYLAILLKYEIDVLLDRKVILNKAEFEKQPAKDQVNIGLIGAGNFTKSMLIPKLEREKSVKIRGIATATGLTAAHTGQKHGCDYATSDYSDFMKDDNIHGVFVATRHNTHSKISAEMLESGKYVFVEKPLAISMEQLDQIMNAWKIAGNKIMVGFNRRFAPMTKKVKEHFKGRTYPIFINYRINAGVLSKESWVQNAEEGGGRIIGEVCHFVDFLQYMTGCYPKRIFAETLHISDQSLEINDNLSATISFPDGSIGTISYLANGDLSYPKERIEIFGGGSICVIDDFMRLEIVKDGKSQKSSGKQDKGHDSEIHEFVEAIRKGEPVPVEFRESIVTTMATFKIMDSLRSGSVEELLIENL